MYFLADLTRRVMVPPSWSIQTSCLEIEYPKALKVPESNQSTQHPEALKSTKRTQMHPNAGTVKSSFSLSLAGCFGQDVYVLNLAYADDGSLNDLFKDPAHHCLVLLEDVDAAGTAHTREIEEDSDEAVTKSTKAEHGGATLSGLLNTIDGVASPEGQILAMTTNHIKYLDKALIRPGRADMKILFRLADKDMMTQLLYIIFKHSDDEPETENTHGEDEMSIESLVAAFISSVPKLGFSPAEIPTFLLQHRRSPHSAVDEAP